MVTWCIPCIYNTNQGQRMFAVHVLCAKGEGHMRCKLPKAEVLGSYIRGIHQLTMIHVIYIYANRLVQRRHFYEVLYMQYIGLVYVCMVCFMTGVVHAQHR